MKTEQPTLITSINAVADHTSSKNKFIGFDGNLCGANAKALGVCNANTAINNQMPVMAKGIALVLSGAAVSVGAKIASDANAKAVTYSTGEHNGFTLDSASGADELIRVILS